MPMTFDEFMQAYENQGGPFPSAWSPEAIAEAQAKANMMGIAEFRPANARELMIRSRLKEIEQHNLNNKQGTARDLMQKLKSEVPLEELTPQSTQGRGLSWGVEDTYGAGSFKKQVTPEINKDMLDIGYDIRPETVRKKGAAYKNLAERLPNKWNEFNERITSEKRPENLFHITPEENLQSISQSGLVPAGGTRRGTNPEARTFQGGKTFFSEKPLDQWIEGVHGDRKLSTLRTKLNEDMSPDMFGQDISWQTRKPVMPQSLEIETAPGQWQNLIDYMKNRGGK